MSKQTVLYALVYQTDGYGAWTTARVFTNFNKAKEIFELLQEVCVCKTWDVKEVKQFGN